MRQMLCLCRTADHIPGLVGLSHLGSRPTISMSQTKAIQVDTQSAVTSPLSEDGHLPVVVFIWLMNFSVAIWIECKCHNLDHQTNLTKKHAGVPFLHILDHWETVLFCYAGFSFLHNFDQRVTVLLCSVYPRPGHGNRLNSRKKKF